MATPLGNTHTGMKNYNNSEFLLNNVSVTMTITDPTRYFSGFRAEFYVKDYSSENAKTITLKTGGVTSDSGMSPYDSLSHSDLVLIGNCSTKPQEFTFYFSYVSNNGVRLRFIYAEFGTYSTEEQVANFAAGFNSANVCGTNSTDGLNETKWEEQEVIYLALSSAARSALTESDETQGALGQCLERYDRVVYLHGESYDFMGRVEAGKVTPRANFAPLEVNNNNSLAIIVVVSSIASLSLVAFFMLKKKSKEK